jgi:hypothetical protein
MQNILVDFFKNHSRMKIYLTSNVKVGINAILIVSFILTCYTSKLNESMEVSIMKLKKSFESTFLCLCWKLTYLKFGFE